MIIATITSNTEIKTLQQEEHYSNEIIVACRSRNNQSLNYNGRLVAALASAKNINDCPTAVVYVGSLQRAIIYIFCSVVFIPSPTTSKEIL